MIMLGVLTLVKIFGFDLGDMGVLIGWGKWN